MLVRTMGLVALLVGLPGCGSIVVDRIKPGTAVPANGVIYALPNTVVRVGIKIDRTEKVGARFVAYAPLFVPGSTPVCKKPTCTKKETPEFSVQDGATFTTYGEPDPDNVFLVRFSGGGVIDQTMTMTWNENGLASGVGAVVTNRSIDIAVSALKLVTGVATKFAGGAAVADKTTPPKACPDDFKPSFADEWFVPRIFDYAGQDAGELLYGQFCGLPRETREDLPKQDALFRSAIVFWEQNIFSLVTARNAVLRTQSFSLDVNALLTRLDAETDKALSEAFVGVAKTKTWEGTLDVRTIAERQPVAILRVDPSEGICLTAFAELPPATKSPPGNFLWKSTDCEKAPSIDATFDIYPAAQKQLFSRITDSSDGDRSFRYRIPAQVKGTITYATKPYGTGVFSVAQLGTVISLPATQSSRQLNYDLGFVEATGALKTFKLGTVGGVDAGTIDALASVGGTLSDLRNARKPADELTVLTREYQLMKVRKGYLRHTEGEMAWSAT